MERGGGGGVRGLIAAPVPIQTERRDADTGYRIAAATHAATCKLAQPWKQTTVGALHEDVGAVHFSQLTLHNTSGTGG